MKICKGAMCLFKADKKCNLYVCSAQSMACVSNLANVVRVERPCCGIIDLVI